MQLVEELGKMAELPKKIEGIEVKQKQLESRQVDVEREFRAMREGQYPQTVIGRLAEITNHVMKFVDKFSILEGKVNRLERHVLSDDINDEDMTSMYTRFKLKGGTLKTINSFLGRGTDDLTYARRVVKNECKDIDIRLKVFEFMKSEIEK